MRAIKACLLAVALLGPFLSLHSLLAQDVSIVNPTPGANVQPGQKLNIVLSIQGTTSSVNHLAFSIGFKNSPKDEKSLGRPYVGTVSLAPGSHDAVLDPAKGTYSFDITVPSAKDFLDGFSAPYNLTVSDYYLLGATFTPILKMTSVQVNVQDNNSSGGNPTNGGSPGNQPNPSNGGNQSNVPNNSSNGGDGNGAKPTSPAEKLRLPYLLAACLLTFHILNA